MNRHNKICPYPGLRPFNEEESLFFKGRQEHVGQIISRLSEHKFLMVTGASGDGKSSLVYAGVIPQARAGFFKAKHNNWVVADFRPERAPLKNMAEALGRALDMPNKEAIESELQYGFSALLDVYQASTRHLDTHDAEYTTLDDKTKKIKRLRAANLLVIVDQFEEFFTNRENFAEGKCSPEAQTAVNILLETARLAQQRDIPIYIICTMRSDFVGQCAAFRGLPEYIGMAQFFLPRLKRNEIARVIQEPARLNGDHISKRLVETLINSLSEGIDQLPVLQHALKRIWYCAGEGTEEMDLLHFAKVGGLHSRFLNDVDREAFTTWLATLPDYEKAHFAHPSLDNVLDSHANSLYEGAAREVNLLYGKNRVTDAEAKQVIEKVFKCLTKIDESRAVRNRMTLQEVKDIINEPDVTLELTAAVVNVFRRSDNTFLRPFITDDESTAKLSPNTVLDITHESLIRNWKLLKTWTEQEHEKLLNFQDFDKQMQRWLEHNKSSNFLLPIGLLTFFENWMQRERPNRYWLAKYNEAGATTLEKLANADAHLSLAAGFLKKSGQKLFVGRTVAKYGADNLLVAFGLLVLVISCTYFYFDYRTKQPDYVIEEILKKGEKLLSSKYVKADVKADFIIAEERLKPGSWQRLVETVPGDSLQLDVVKKMMTVCLRCQEHKGESEPDNPLIAPLIKYQLQKITSMGVFKDRKCFEKNIPEALVIPFEIKLAEKYHFQGTDFESMRKSVCEDGAYGMTVMVLRDTVAMTGKMDNTLLLLNALPIFANFDSARMAAAISNLDPSTDWGQRIIEKHLFGSAPTGNFKARFRAYYAYMKIYAFLGRQPELTKTIAQFNKANEAFPIVTAEEKQSLLDATIELASCMAVSGTYDVSAISACCSLLTSPAKLTSELPFPILVVNTESIHHILPDIGNSNICNFNSICNGGVLEWVDWSDSYLDFKHKEELIDGWISAIGNKHLGSEQFFERAVLYKFKMINGVLYDSVSENRVSYMISMSNYNWTDSDFLNKKFSTSTPYFSSRGQFFRAPFLVDLVNLSEYGTKTEDYFQPLLGAEKMASPLGFFDCELINAFQRPDRLNREVDMDLLIAGAKLLTDLNNFKPLNFHPAIFINQMFACNDSDAFSAFLGLYYHSIHDTSMAKTFLDHVELGRLLPKIYGRETGYRSYILRHFYLPLFDATAILQARTRAHDKRSEKMFDAEYLMHVADTLPDDYQKRDFLLTCIDTFIRAHQESEAIAFTDRLLGKFSTSTSTFGNKVFEILGRIATGGGLKIALQLTKTKDDNDKGKCFYFLSKGLCESGRYYDAYSLIPNYASSNNQLSLYNVMLNGFKTIRLSDKYDGWSYLNLSEKNMKFDDDEMNKNPYERTLLYGVFQSHGD